MGNFADHVQEWQVFYAAMAGISATLVGLLFFALTLNVDLFLQAENFYLKRLSRMVLGSFVLVMFSSLMFLVPRQSAWGLATPLFCFGCVSVWDSIHTFLELRPHRGHVPAADRRRMQRAIRRALLGRGTLVVASLLLFTDLPGLFYWISAPLMVSLLAACQNCWDLLVVARERIEH